MVTTSHPGVVTLETSVRRAHPFTSRTYALHALAIVLHRRIARMSSKSSPRTRALPPLPTERPRAIAAPDTHSGSVIPFARPRSISSLPTTFTKPGQSPAPPPATSWGSAARSALAAAPSLPMPQVTKAPPPPILVPPLALAPPVISPPRPPVVYVPDTLEESVPNLRGRWAPFEKLGMVAKSVDPKQWSRHVVTAYRMLGFAIL